MTYTKKKIAIETEVPEGATHFGITGWGKHFDWWRIGEDKRCWWNDISNEWVTTHDTKPKDIREIEVIEQ